MRGGPDWYRSYRDSSGSCRDREGLDILGHSEPGEDTLSQDTPGWASDLGWPQPDQQSVKRKQTFNIKFPLRSDMVFSLTSALGQNPRLTPWHQPGQARASRGATMSPPISCGNADSATRPTYINGCRTFSEEQNIQGQLASASLQLPQLLLLQATSLGTF